MLGGYECDKNTSRATASKQQFLSNANDNAIHSKVFTELDPDV